MVDKSLKRWWRPGGLTISLLLHAVVAGGLVLAFLIQPEPQTEEPVVEVSLVAPPEPAAEEPPVEEVKPEEPAAGEPPAPGPPPAPEPPKLPEAEPPAPPEPPPAQTEVEEQPTLPDTGKAPIPVLRPVVRFAEKDTGPEISNGTEADAALTPEGAAKLEEAEREVAAATPQPEIDLPEANLAEEAPMPDAADEVVEGGGAEAAPPAASEPPPDEAKASEATAAANERAKPIKEAALVPRAVKKLFSKAISEDAQAATAMAGLSRQKRGDLLCGTELSQQLRNGRPSFVPYALPILPLKEGNVIDVPLTAFREIGGAWINIGVRCEVDDNATEVVKFSLSIGKPVPKAEWRSRRFPEI